MVVIAILVVIVLMVVVVVVGVFLIDVVYTCLGGNLGCCCLRCCGSWEGRL